MAAFRQCDWDFYEQVVPRNKSYCKRSPWAATCESISRPVQGGPACKFGENHERKGRLALPVASSHSTHPISSSSRFFLPGLPPHGRLREHKEGSFRPVTMSPRGRFLHPFILGLILAKINPSNNWKDLDSYFLYRLAFSVKCMLNPFLLYLLFHYLALYKITLFQAENNHI